MTQRHHLLVTRKFQEKHEKKSIPCLYATLRDTGRNRNRESFARVVLGMKLMPDDIQPLKHRICGIAKKQL